MNAANFRTITDAAIAQRATSDDQQAQAVVDGFLIYGQGAAREGQSAAYVCEYILPDRDRPFTNSIGPWAPPSGTVLPEVSPAVAQLVNSKLAALNFVVEDLEQHFPKRKLKASW